MNDVKELRNKLGMTQLEFSAKFHINVATLRTWEQGVRNCPGHTKYMMARIVELEERLGEGDSHA